MLRLSPLFALAALLSFVRIAGAQGSGPGFPAAIPQDCIGGVCVNLQSLAQTLVVPVMSKSGAFPFSFSFTQNFYMIEGGGGWEPSISYAAGMFYTNASGIGTLAGYSTPTATTCPGGSPATTKYANWYVLDPAGTKHPLPSTDYADSQGCLSGSGFTDQTIDASGYTATVSAAGSASIETSGGAAIYSTGITDSNGNTITLAPSTGIYTDTLGLAALTYSTTASTQKAAWTDVNGGSPYVKITDTTGLTVRTNFGCSGIIDFNFSGQQLPASISFPDGTSMGFTYEGTNGFSGDYTGRLAKVTMRPGGTIQYNWNPNSLANDGINCAYQIPEALTVQTADGIVTYSTSVTSLASITTKLDIGKNKTVYYFLVASNGGYVLSDVLSYPNIGSVGTPNYSTTPTRTDYYCYNGTGFPCGTTNPTLPFTQIDHYVNLGLAAGNSRQETQFDGGPSGSGRHYGNVTYSAQYDWGGTTPVVATTNTIAVNGSGNCSGVAATVNNKVCSSTTTVNGNTVSASKFAYSSAGNLLTAYSSPNGGSSYLSNPTVNSYNANGTPSTLYDFAGNSTVYAYTPGYYASCTGCSQYPFPTEITKGGLHSYAYFNGIGGVKTEDVDASGNDTTYCYTSGSGCSGGTADPWGHVLSVTDPLSNVITKTYAVTSRTGDFSFNSSNSVQNLTTTLDWDGRVINTQKQQGPSLSNYDSVSSSFNFSGVNPTVFTSNPCSASLGNSCSTYGPMSTIDMWGRTIKSVQSGSNATDTITYSQNDVTSVLSPAPSGENTKGVEKEYDGLGRLTTTCAISSLVSGEVSCGQNTGSNSGILTTTAYTSATGSQTVTVSRGPSNQQQRSIKTDGLGRVLQKKTPEGGTWTYTYDTNASCPSGWRGASGQLASVKDPNLNLLCYSYDSLNRVTGINANGTACRWFYYDNGEGNGTTSGGYTGTVPTGITLSNQYGRMVEAATDSCTAVASHTSSTIVTDLWWAYDKVGDTTNMWELTPNSTQYYNSSATFYGNRTVDEMTLSSPSILHTIYDLDGEGRWNIFYINGSGNTMASSTTYNAASLATLIKNGAGTDYDSYTYDNNTQQMTGWTFQVNSVAETGALNWNSNNTLKQLTITDGFNANGSVTCSYNSSLVTNTGYDDLSRLVGHSCTGPGGTWSQAFSYDQYSNLTKSGTGLPSWNPGYSAATNHYTCTGCTYDSNGDVTNDGMNTYTWNAFSKMASVNMSGTGCSTNGDCIVYDALGRVAEIDDGSTKEEIWYTQLGKAYMNGTSFLYGYFPGPGGETAFVLGGDAYVMHKDWLGNARLISEVNYSTVYTDQAYAPYGEVFNIFGSARQPDTMFGGGSTQDIFAGMYDTPNRELQGSQQGRFLSPDPAGAGWNQYAYVPNPNSFSDPSGLSPASDDALLWNENGETGATPAWYLRMVGQSSGGGGAVQPQTSGTVGADGGPGSGESVTTTILYPDDDGTLWYTDNGGNQYFSTDNGQNWDMQMYGPWGSGGEVFGAGNAYQGPGVDTSTSVQVGIIEGDGTNLYVDVNPGVGVFENQTLNGPTPDQTVLFNASGGAGTNSVGTSIVQNPDGSMQPQGTTFSEGLGMNAFGDWQVQFPLSFTPQNHPSPFGPWLVQTNLGVIDLDPDSCFCLQ